MVSIQLSAKCAPVALLEKQQKTIAIPVQTNALLEKQNAADLTSKPVEILTLILALNGQAIKNAITAVPTENAITKPVLLDINAKTQAQKHTKTKTAAGTT